MAPRLSLFTVRSVTFRTRPIVPQKRFAPCRVHERFASDDATSRTAAKNSNQDPLPNVSQEAAAIDKSMGTNPPEIEQGTPIQEIFARDTDAQERAPEVLKKQLNDKRNGGASSPSAPRSSSMSAQSSAEAELVKFENTRAEGLDYPDAGLGYKFPLPNVADIPRTDHLKRRYDAVVDQVTKSIMRDGKLSRAQANMSIILDILRTAPPPQANAQFPGRNLLTSKPRDALPLSPVEYLTTVIDSVAPVIKIRQQRGIAGGGASLPIPVPLRIRQRRRTAIQWILTSAQSRRDTRLADRVAKEIISVAEGKSSAWERRAMVHRLAVSARSNVRLSAPRGGRR